METSHLLGLISLIIGLVLVAILLLIIWRHKQFREDIRVVETTATIIENVSKHFSDKMYYPILEFTTENGETITKQSKMGSNPPRFKKGEQVTIYYHIDKPEKYQVKAGWPYCLFISIFLLWGIAMCVIGVIPFTL